MNVLVAFATLWNVASFLIHTMADGKLPFQPGYEALGPPTTTLPTNASFFVKIKEAKRNDRNDGATVSSDGEATKLPTWSPFSSQLIGRFSGSVHPLNGYSFRRVRGPGGKTATITNPTTSSHLRHPKVQL